VIEPLGLSVTDAAKALGVTRPALSALLNGHAALSPEMAIRIEKAFGPKMDTLVRMQTAYDIAAARDRADEIEVKRYAPRDRHAPSARTKPVSEGRSWQAG
jgi:addiction module HigA family antidote